MTEYEMRPMIEKEDKYAFSQSSQLSEQTGLIGYLRADMGTDGNNFFSSWMDWREDRKTAEFKAEFDDIINSLREEHDILHDRKTLAKYCYSHPQAAMNSEMENFGVRVDTDKYTYLLRLNPNRGEYNLYCYCYIRDWLNDHIRKAEKGIRFITPDYKEKFRLPDGGKIRVRTKDGTTFDEVCRYIDDTHVEVGRNLYHIAEYAERLEQSGNIIAPLCDCESNHSEISSVQAKKVLSTITMLEKTSIRLI